MCRLSEFVMMKEKGGDCMKRQIWFYFACLVMVVGVAIAGASIWQVWNHNHLLEKNFVEKEELEKAASVYGKSPYGQHLRNVADGKYSY